MRAFLAGRCLCTVPWRSMLELARRSLVVLDVTGSVVLDLKFGVNYENSLPSPNRNETPPQTVSAHYLFTCSFTSVRALLEYLSRVRLECEAASSWSPEPLFFCLKQSFVCNFNFLFCLITSVCKTLVLRFAPKRPLTLISPWSGPMSCQDTVVFALDV